MANKRCKKADNYLGPGADSRGGKHATTTSIDFKKLNDMPVKLVDVCEQTLSKRKEIIDWFETLKKEEKGISVHKLSKKINEFNAENEMLKSALQSCKIEFVKEMDEVVDYLRKGMNDTIALQLRAEALTYQLSELNSVNADLRKQIQTAEHLRSTNNKQKIEQLEKMLKEEKSKKLVLRDRLTRADGQVKIGHERALHLEASLDQAQSQNWALERTIEHLHSQNQKLQAEFDKELTKLTDSIRANTIHLKEIAEAREKLQTEKEELEKRLQELSDQYKYSIEKMQREENENAAKLAETEKNFAVEKEERRKLEIKLEELSTKMNESEMSYKDVLQQMQETDAQCNEIKNVKTALEDEVITMKTDLEEARQALQNAHMEVEEYRKRIMRQGDIIRDIERNFKNLLGEVKKKDEQIEQLLKKEKSLEQQLQEGEMKMGSYEQQLSSLKTHIKQLREEFGEFENLAQLHEKINEQRERLTEATRMNEKLTQALHKKEAEVEGNLEQMRHQQTIFEQREELIKSLKDNETELNKTINCLQENLRHMESEEEDISQQLCEKTTEVDALMSTLETKKQQISQLEKIILTLEDQLRKVNLQRRKDQEKLGLFEKTLREYETYNLERQRSVEAPSENLDNLIQILEDELGTSVEIETKNREVRILKKQCFNDRRREKLEKYECLDEESHLYQTQHEKGPPKIVINNLSKKAFVTKNDDQHGGDKLDRKKALTNMESQKWVPHEALNAAYPVARGVMPMANSKDYESSLIRNIQLLTQNHEEKKSKMFKFAGHRL